MLLGGLVMAGSFPLLPWVADGWLGGQLQPLAGWLGLPGGILHRTLILLGLTACALGLPRVAWAGRRRPMAEVACLGAGCLLVLEPLLQLGLQGVTILLPLPRLSELILPMPVARRGWLLLAGLLWWALLPALVEEFLFRARLLPWLAQRLEPVSAVTLSTLLFAIAHGTVAQMALALPLGLLLGWLRLQTDRWYPCFLVHCLHNVLVVLLGGMVTASPILPALLFLTGGWLLAFAWSVRGRAAPALINRRMIVAGGAVLAVVLLLWPVWRPLQDGVWSRAAIALLQRPACNHAWAAERLDRLIVGGVVTPARRARLLAWLQEGRDVLPPVERRWLVAVLSPMALVEEVAEQTGGPVPPLARQRPAYRALVDLARCPRSPPRLVEAAQGLIAQDPLAGATLLADEPRCLMIWLDWPERADGLLTLLSQLPPRPKRALLGQLFRSWPAEQVMAALRCLEPAAVGPVERTAFRRYHPDPAAWLARLASSDVDRAAAWRVPLPAPPMAVPDR